MSCSGGRGHNEGDEPSFTEPRGYKAVKEHRSVRKVYTETLLRKGDIDPKEAESWLDNFHSKLQEAFDRTREDNEPPSSSERGPLWTDEESTGCQNQPSPEASGPRGRRH